jgi:hypothetical protein
MERGIPRLHGAHDDKIGPATGAHQTVELESKSVKELREICRDKGIDTVTCADKRDLVDLIISSFSNSTLVTASNACAGAADRTTGAKLFKAAHDGDAEEVITLLSKPGVQRFINYQNAVGRTPLSIAIFGGYSTVTKELIKARCDTDLQGEHGSRCDVNVQVTGRNQRLQLENDRLRTLLRGAGLDDRPPPPSAPPPAAGGSPAVPAVGTGAAVAPPPPPPPPLPSHSQPPSPPGSPGRP